MFCGSCGVQIKEGAAFCPNCGWAAPKPTVEKPVALRCASCGVAVKEGAKFCPGCGTVVTVESVSNENPSDGAKPDTPPHVKSGKIDKAIFWHLGNQLYACYLYKNDIVVGTMTDSAGAFIPDIKEFLEATYENIQIEMKEGE
jgi:uncharacterized Zn finger protein (UPF0148 family)